MSHDTFTHCAGPWLASAIASKSVPALTTRRSPPLRCMPFHTDAWARFLARQPHDHLVDRAAALRAIVQDIETELV